MIYWMQINYSDFEWFNENIASNEEQKRAVVNIYNKSSYPAPFILYGPPGTGKTSTLVEAILQVAKSLNTQANIESIIKNRILICAPSNSAADTIVKKLIELDCNEKFIRLYSRAQSGSKIETGIYPYAHIYEDAYDLDKIVSSHSIIICTLCFCARLVECDLMDFSYIFIDEAGQATEADALIPFNMEDYYHIVIAGDPWQLQPYVKGQFAKPILGTSLLERLMQRKLYQKDNNQSYNSNYIVKLLNNYRSHPSIVKLSNELFYENELKSFGSGDEHLSKIWSFLPENFFPIIFHRVQGCEEKKRPSTSSYNAEEILTVLNYLKYLIGMKLNGITINAENIGVITPFTLQRDMIKKNLNLIKGAQEVEIGTVERFQGREKDVIIISTVRSKVLENNHLGILFNPRRFNVAITRAKALLIIIGNPKALKYDRNWLKTINVCIKNKSCQGTPFKKSKISLPPILQNKKDGDDQKIIDVSNLPLFSTLSIEDIGILGRLSI